MSLRTKLALTVFATGIVTTLLVIATVIYAFQRFEHEMTYRRGTAFLQRVVANHDNLFEMHERRPVEFMAWLRNIVLFEPDTQLYLLDLNGTVLASSGSVKLAPDFKVALQPVLQAVGQSDAAYVMGDDPERMDANAVVAVQPVRHGEMWPSDPVAGYLYLVLHAGQLPEGRWAAVRMSVARPALGLIAAVVAFTTLAAVLIIVSVTRPLQRLTNAVATLSKRGLEDDSGGGPQTVLPPATHDEFGQLTSAFVMLIDICRAQWNELRRLDHFRREGISNLSHDLRSPLPATVACLETLEARWHLDGAAEAAHTDDQRLVEIALRNTRNAARLVQSLGDLAKLDEPEFKLRPQVVDAAELLDDICLRFTQRAVEFGVSLQTSQEAASNSPNSASVPAFAAIDIELFERAVANLVDNALKFCVAGNHIVLAAVARGTDVQVSVVDDGIGIAPNDLSHLFDRFYQSRQSVAPATGEGGRGLGLAIVKRIVELHGGAVTVESQLGRGTKVVLSMPGAAR